MAETLSPELGSIEVAQAPAPETPRNHLAGIGEEATGLLTDFIDNKKVGDTRDVFTETTDELLAQGSETPDEQPGPPASRGDEATRGVAFLRTLQAGVDQATGSRKAALELELRKAVQEAGDADPRLRQRFEQEFARFVRTDPEVQAIAMLDVGDANYSASAAQQLSEIKDHAYGTVSSGGLGMTPKLGNFGDRAFVQEYLYKNGKRDVVNNRQLLLASASSAEDVDSRAAAENFQSTMQGVSNSVSAGIETAMDMTQRVGKALADPTAPDAALTISQWDEFGREAVLQDLNVAVFQIEDAFGRIPVNQAHTDGYQAAKALRDDRVGALNTLIQGVTGDSTTIMKAYEAYEIKQKINFERKNPKFVHDARILTDLVPILDLIDADFGAAGDIIRNNIAGFLNQGLPAVLGRSIGKTGHDDLLPNASSTQLGNHYKQIRTDTDNMYDVGDTSARADRTHASTEITAKSRDSFLQMATKEGVTPRIAAAHAGSVGADIDQLLTSGEPEADALSQAVLDLSNPGWLDMAQIAQKGDQPEAAVYLGEQMQNLMFQYEPVRLARYNELRTTQVADQLFAAQVISVDDSNIRKGEVVFQVNEDLIRKTIVESPGQQLPSFEFQRGVSRAVSTGHEDRVAQAIRKANQVAAELTRQVSSDLRTSAHGSVLTQGLTTPSYTAEWERNRFSQFFGELDSEQPSPNDKLNISEQ